VSSAPRIRRRHLREPPGSAPARRSLMPLVSRATRRAFGARGDPWRGPDAAGAAGGQRACARRSASRRLPGRVGRRVGAAATALPAASPCTCRAASHARRANSSAHFAAAVASLTRHPLPPSCSRSTFAVTLDVLNELDIATPCHRSTASATRKPAVYAALAAFAAGSAEEETSTALRPLRRDLRHWTILHRRPGRLRAAGAAALLAAPGRAKIALAAQTQCRCSSRSRARDRLNARRSGTSSGSRRRST
jgi:hypothetical protein